MRVLDSAIMLSAVLCVTIGGCAVEAKNAPAVPTEEDVAEGAKPSLFSFGCWEQDRISFQVREVVAAKFLPANAWELTQKRYKGFPDVTMYYTPKPGELCGVGQ